MADKTTHAAKKAVNVFDARTDGTTLNLTINGEDIGMWWGVTQENIFYALRNNRNINRINMLLCSDGGAAKDAFAIYDLLKSYPAEVHIYCIGEVCSAATIIAMAGDRIYVTKQCLWMIHNAAFQYTGGNADQLQKDVDYLRLVDNRIVDVYDRRTGLGSDTLRALMAETTWFEPEEALALGFVDEIVETIDVNFMLNEPVYVGVQSIAPNYEYAAYDAVNSFRLTGATNYKVALNKYAGPGGYSPISDIKTDAINKRKETPAVAKIPNTKKVYTMLDGLKSKIVALLVTAGLVTEENKEAAENAISGLDTEMETAIDTAISKKIAANTGGSNATPINGQALVNILSTADETTSTALRTALAKFLPVVASTDEGNDDDAVAARIDALQTEIANLKQGRTMPATATNGNGKAPIAPATKEGANGEVTAQRKAELKFYLEGFAKNTISADDFKNIAGMTVAEAKVIVTPAA